MKGAVVLALSGGVVVQNVPLREAIDMELLEMTDYRAYNATPEDVLAYRLTIRAVVREQADAKAKSDSASR